MHLPHRGILLVALTLLLACVVAAQAAPTGGGTATAKGPGQHGQMGEHQGIDSIINWLKSKGVDKLADLTPDKRAQLWAEYRQEHGLPSPEERVHNMVTFLISQGITTTADLRKVTDDQAQQLRQKFMDQQKQNHPKAGGAKAGSSGGPGMGGGGGGGQFGPEMLGHLADMLENNGVTNLSDLTLDKIKEIRQKMQSQNPGNGTATGPNGGAGHQKGQGRGRGMGLFGDEGDMVGRVIDWLQTKGITSLSQLTPDKIAELKQEWQQERGQGGGGDHPHPQGGGGK